MNEILTSWSLYSSGRKQAIDYKQKLYMPTPRYVLGRHFLKGKGVNGDEEKEAILDMGQG